MERIILQIAIAFAALVVIGSGIFIRPACAPRRPLAPSSCCSWSWCSFRCCGLASGMSHIKRRGRIEIFNSASCASRCDCGGRMRAGGRWHSWDCLWSAMGRHRQPRGGCEPSALYVGIAARDRVVVLAGYSRYRAADDMGCAADFHCRHGRTGAPGRRDFRNRCRDDGNGLFLDDGIGRDAAGLDLATPACRSAVVTGKRILLWLIAAALAAVVAIFIWKFYLHLTDDGQIQPGIIFERTDRPSRA